MHANQRLAPGLRGPLHRPHELEAFAVDDTWAQAVWRWSGPPGRGRLRVTGDLRELEVDLTPGPGSALVDGLVPATEYRLELVSDGRVLRSPTFHTLPGLDGPELIRLATVNDCHLGLSTFGTYRPFRDQPGRRPHAEAALASAIEELTAWGATTLVVKGDLTQRAQPREWRRAARMLDESGLDLVVVPGNHDMVPRGVDGGPLLAEQGIRLRHGVSHIDRAGVRLVLVDTVIPGEHHGRLEPFADALVEAVATAPGPALVFMHHYVQRWAFPDTWPRGVPGPEGRAVLDRLGAANPAVLVTSGHTHRHRRHVHGPLALTEIGSTKDFPGTWAGYRVSAAGVHQVVRRISAPDTLAWTEQTARVLCGLWGWWSPGTLDQRCLAHPWPIR